MSQTSILDAIERDDIDTVRRLLDQGLEPSEPVGEGGDLALCWAGAYGRLAIAKLLVERGAELDAAPAHGMGGPALHDALFENQLEVAQFLADAGAHIDYASAAALGRTDLLTARETDDSERWAGFLSACKTGQLASVTYLVDGGIDVAKFPPGEEWGGIGASGLHWAVSGGHEELVRWLVAAGTPVDIVDDTFANTPLGWALQDGDDAMAAVLVSLGADIALADGS